jgi:hypothetical protein
LRIMTDYPDRLLALLNAFPPPLDPHCVSKRGAANPGRCRLSRRLAHSTTYATSDPPMTLELSPQCTSAACALYGPCTLYKACLLAVDLRVQ